MALVIKETYAAPSGNNGNMANPIWRVAQTFTASASYDIVAIRLGLSIGAGADPGNVTISIRATDGDGKPTGGDLAALTFDGSTLTNNVNGETTVRLFDSPYSLVAGTVYAIVLRKDSIQELGGLRYYKKTTVGGYADGKHLSSFDEGSTWSPSDFTDWKFATYGESLAAAVLDAPADETTGYYLNSDYLAEFTWAHELINGFEGETHTVWFGPIGEMVEQTDRSRYSIISNKWYCDTTLEYYTVYEWKVVTTYAGETVESGAFGLTTIVFYPPLPSGEVAGAGGELGGEGGKNNMVTVKRLVAAANNTVFYEDA